MQIENVVKGNVPGDTIAEKLSGKGASTKNTNAPPGKSAGIPSATPVEKLPGATAVASADMSNGPPKLSYASIVSKANQNNAAASVVNGEPVVSDLKTDNSICANHVNNSAAAVVTAGRSKSPDLKSPSNDATVAPTLVRKSEERTDEYRPRNDRDDNRYERYVDNKYDRRTGDKEYDNRRNDPSDDYKYDNRRDDKYDNRREYYNSERRGYDGPSRGYRGRGGYRGNNYNRDYNNRGGGDRDSNYNTYNRADSYRDSYVRGGSDSYNRGSEGGYKPRGEYRGGYRGRGGYINHRREERLVRD